VIDFTDEYEPYISEQVVIDIQQNQNPGVQEMVQPRNNINDTEITTMDNEIVPPTQMEYGYNIQQMVRVSLEIDDEIYEPNDNEQEIIKKDNQYRNEGIVDKTHRYHLRATRSDWRNKYAEEYSTPVVLSNLWVTPKAIRLYGVEACTSIM